MTFDTWLSELKALVASGNRQLAVNRLDEDESASLTSTEVQRLFQQIGTMPRPVFGFFFPVASIAGGSSFWCRVSLAAPGPEAVQEDRIKGLPDSLHDNAWEAVSAAWAEVGGEGERPPLVISFSPPLDRGARVSGRSFSLALILATAGHLAGQRPLHNVLATGCPGEALREIEAKVALHRATREELQTDLILALSATERPHTTSQDGTRVRFVEDLREAVLFAFGGLLWSAIGDWPCLHAYMGDRARPPARFLGRRSTVLPLGAQDLNGPESLTQATRAVVDAIERIIDEERARASASSARPIRIDLSLGGPAVLAASVGHALRNRPGVEVHFVDASSNEVWWNHQRQRPNTRPSPPPTEPIPRRVVVARNPSAVPRDEWESIQVPATLQRGDVDDTVWDTVDALEHCPDLHLAFETPLALAFAITGVLARRRRIRLYHWQAQTRKYVCWFDDRHGLSEG